MFFTQDSNTIIGVCEFSRVISKSVLYRAVDRRFRRTKSYPNVSDKQQVVWIGAHVAYEVGESSKDDRC